MFGAIVIALLVVIGVGAWLTPSQKAHVQKSLEGRSARVVEASASAWSRAARWGSDKWKEARGRKPRDIKF